jgi:hypothetical protein
LWRTPISTLHRGAAALSYRIDYLRQKFHREYPIGGVTLDPEVRVQRPRALLAYLPRALFLGLFAPLPDTWFRQGGQVRLAGHLLGGAEMVFMYGVMVLGLFRTLQNPKHERFFLLSIALLGALALGLTVPNAGTLYRLRYVFFVLLILLAFVPDQALRQGNPRAKPP